MGEGGEGLFAFGGVDGGVDAEMAGEDTVNIAIDHCCRQSEGDAPDGCCRIVAHTLQLPDLLDGVREMAEGHNLFGGIMQIAGPTVITQSLPLTQHLVLRSPSKGLNRRPTAHKPFPIVPALFHLRLLEDDLRQPDSIRVVSLPPRQLTTMLLEPFQ